MLGKKQECKESRKILLRYDKKIIMRETMVQMMAIRVYWCA